MKATTRPEDYDVERHYRWVSWLGALLYVQVVLAVGLFFVLGGTPYGSWSTQVLGTRLFEPLFISIPITAVVYLLAVILFLFYDSVGKKKHERVAIQSTVVIALLVMVYCVWWVSRAFLG